MTFSNVTYFLLSIYLSASPSVNVGFCPRILILFMNSSHTRNRRSPQKRFTLCEFCRNHLVGLYIFIYYNYFEIFVTLWSLENFIPGFVNKIVRVKLTGGEMCIPTYMYYNDIREFNIGTKSLVLRQSLTIYKL